ncbi:MAG: M42 family metallopeptidase [Fervidobacterium sp.]
MIDELRKTGHLTLENSKIISDLVELCSVPGVSGREEKVREKIISMITTKYRVDNIGNLIVEQERNVKNKKILKNEINERNVILLAHMDEIGFYITSLRGDGKLEIRNVGGIVEETVQGSFVKVVTKQGVLDGVIGTVPPHLRNDGVTFDKCIDVGARNKEELVTLGISIMDYAVFWKDHAILNNDILSMRSLDDRFGCYVLVELSKLSKMSEYFWNPTFVWTVQEEVGLRGAKAIVDSFSKRKDRSYDLAIAIDSFACCSKQNQHICLGNGPVIRSFDNSSISNYTVVNAFLDIAEKNNIPVQLGTTGGGNDASVFVEYGIPMVALSVPVRYLHSQVEMVHINDVKNLIRLLDAFLKTNFKEEI